MDAARSGPGDHLLALGEEVRGELQATHAAREVGLAACRRAVQFCGRAIRAIHRREDEQVAALTASARDAIAEAQRVLRPHPAVAYAGFLHDAEKEYAEALLTAALIRGERIPTYRDVGVGLPAWMNGLAEAASELRRHLLDRLRGGELSRAEELLVAMEDVYDLLVGIDYPDAITGGLRRTTDALRAVLERSRADVTTTVLQTRLQRALEGRSGADLG